MTGRKPSIAGALAGALLLLASCTPQANTTGATAPLPPAAKLLVADKALADAANLATKALITAKQQGKINAADATLGEKYCLAVAKLTDDIADEITTNDTGATLRNKLLSIVAADTLPTLAQLSPAAAAIVGAAVTAVGQLTVQIGGLQ